jgi:hypothetical protein
MAGLLTGNLAQRSCALRGSKHPLDRTAPRRGSLLTAPARIEPVGRRGAQRVVVATRSIQWTGIPAPVLRPGRYTRVPRADTANGALPEVSFDIT